MAAPRVFTDQDIVSGTRLELEPGPSRHLGAALRLRTGDPVVVFNGRGGEYGASVESITRNRVTLAVADFEAADRESPLIVHLGLCASRGERMDWALQKSCELGVTEVTPLLSERTGLKLAGERAEKKRRHWQQVMVSACEQCGRNRVPRVNPLYPLGAWLDGSSAELRLVLQPGDHPALPARETPAEVELLIGPEGGLTDAELALAAEHEFAAITLGPRVLRTETAPAAALAILQLTWGDL